MKILILNGPNLNLLGIREPNIYGDQTFETYLKNVRIKFKDIQISYFQSNIEGELINEIHEKGFSYDGIVLNAGAYTHTSIAIADAIKSITTPVIEVHISNTFTREKYRKKSYLSPVCIGIITGFGLKSYEMAITYFTL
jgi:3-dehydroquinate dehydratase-2